MATYRVKVSSYTTGDRHIIEVEAPCKNAAYDIATSFGVVCDAPQAVTGSSPWSVELTDGFTVECR